MTNCRLMCSSLRLQLCSNLLSCTTGWWDDEEGRTCPYEKVHSTMREGMNLSNQDVCRSSRRFITTPSQTPGPRVPAAARVTDKVYCLFLLNLYRGTK